MEISGSAAFHRLHWEALRDPDLDAPLAVRLPVTRRVERQPSKFELPPERPTLNILVVTARPFGRGDVGYRTISRPLLDALRTAGLPVTVDLVRPGTWEALRGASAGGHRTARRRAGIRSSILICTARSASSPSWNSSGRPGGCCSPGRGGAV